MRIIKISVLSFWLLFSVFVTAQQYHFRNYTVAQGLAASSVNHIFQDSKGYIWFATQGGGASRFNGKEFKNYTRADGLINNDVTCIAEDKNGNIWLGTAQGASQFNGTQFKNYNQTHGLTNGVVYCIYADAQNNIYFATESDGVKILQTTAANLSMRSREGMSRAAGQGWVAFTPLSFGEGLGERSEIYTITPTKNETLYFGTGKGIVKYQNGKATNYSAHPLIKNKSYFSSLTDANGNCWFGSTSGDVIIIHPNDSIEQIELPAMLQSDFIGSIAQDKTGNIYFATDHGLLKCTPTKDVAVHPSIRSREGMSSEARQGWVFKLFSEHQGLSVNTVQAVMADYENNIWAGTLGGGVNLFNSEAFTHYTQTDGLTNQNITAICATLPSMHSREGMSSEARQGWVIGTNQGLFLFTNNKFQKVNSIPQIKNANISSLAVDTKGMLWVTAQEGVFVLQPTANSVELKHTYTELNGEKIISPLKVLHDTKGNTWIATYGSGVFCINGNTAKCYNTKNNFISDKILTVFQDSKHNLWFGTQDKGAIKYDGLHFSPLLRRGVGGEVVSIWSITEDHLGNLYFGTGENGLYRYNGKAITAYTTKNGLSTNYIPALLFDTAQNCLWLGSEKGLDKLSFKTDYSIQSIYTYSEQDGFKPGSINQNGLYINREQQLCIGTVNGLWLFNRLTYAHINTSPKIQLTDLRLFYQPTNWKNFADTLNPQTGLPLNLKLAHNKNHLTFYIQALTATDVLYTHILQEQDEQWSTPAANNEITYTNIAPGTYTFRAKAVNHEGKLSAEEVSFSFTVNPPWWQTWWFRILIIAALIGLLFAFVKIRERALKAENIKLEHTVQLRTKEIQRQKVVVEEMLSEKEVLLKEIHHRVKNNLQTISSMLMLQSAGLKDEQAKKAITESQSRVRSIALVHQKLYQTDGLEKVELHAFVKDLTNQIQSLYRQQSHNVNIQLQIPETNLLIDKAIPLGLILNELFTNSFKYAFTNADNAEINVSLTQLNSADLPSKSKRVKLVYRDNGAGLASKEILENASTLGLRLIKLLSQQIGATLDYSNTNGSEFMFTFTINV